jgi:hypothetical protein
MTPSPAWRAAAAAPPLLRGVAVLHHLVQQLARAVLVAHLLVGLGEVELGGDSCHFGSVPPPAADASPEPPRSRLIARQIAASAPAFRRFGLLVAAAEVQVEVERQPAVGSGRRRGSGWRRGCFGEPRSRLKSIACVLSAVLGATSVVSAKCLSSCRRR